MLLLLQKYLSQASCLLTDAKIKWLKNLLIRLFIWLYRPNMEEAISSKPSDYQSFNDFFARHLKPGARPLYNPTSQSQDKNDRVIISPADGELFSAGSIKEQRMLSSADNNDTTQIDNIKGKSYSVARLLGLDNQSQLLSPFSQGSYAIIYLAPQNYHRVHFPCDAELQLANFISGYLFSVNDKSSRKRPSLYAYNQRLACVCDTVYGKLAYVMVAAMMVSRIGTAWGQEHQAMATGFRDDQVRNFQVGDELGYFAMGSSVVLLWESQDLVPVVDNGSQIQMGQPLYKL